MAIMWNGDHVTLPLRRWYYEVHADLLDATLDFVAAREYTGAEKDESFEMGELLSCFETRLKRWDSVLHERIRAKVQEKKWIMLPKNS